MSKMHVSYHDSRPSSGVNIRGTARPSRNTGGQQQQSAPKSEIEGIYKNPRMTFNLSSTLGCLVELHVKDNAIYEGVFKTFSPNLDIVLELAHQIDAVDPKMVPSNDVVREQLIIKFDDVIRMTAKNADLKYGESESFTDTGISRANMSVGDGTTRELEPWMADNEDTNNSLDEATFSNKTSAIYRPEDMFKDNERKFGVKSSYDDSLDKYTTKLKEEDTPEYHKRREKASRIAKEIEMSTYSRRNTQLENGDEDEEAKYSAVRRPVEPQRDTRATGDRINNHEKHGDKELNSTPRYQPPQQRTKSYENARMNGRNGETLPRGPLEKRGGIGKRSCNSATVSVPNTADLRRFSEDFNLATPAHQDESKVSETHSKRVSRQPEAHKTSPKVSTPSSTSRSSPAIVSGSPSKPNVARVVSPAEPQNEPAVQAQLISQIAATPTSSPSAPAAVAVTSPVASDKNAPTASANPENKSTLNPDAKEFKFNPEAKEFKPVVPQTFPPPASASVSQPKKTATVSVQHGQYNASHQGPVPPRSENVPAQGQPIQQLPPGYPHSSLYNIVQVPSQPSRTVTRMPAHPGPEPQPLYAYNQQTLVPGYMPMPTHSMAPHYPNTAQTPPSSQPGPGMTVAAVSGQHHGQHPGQHHTPYSGPPHAPPIHSIAPGHPYPPHQGANPHVPYGVPQHHSHIGGQASVSVQQGQPGQVRASPQPAPSPAPPGGTQAPYQQPLAPPTQSFYAHAGLYQPGFMAQPHHGIGPQVVYYQPQPGYPAYPPQ